MTIVWIILGSLILCLLTGIVGHRFGDRKNIFARIGTGAVVFSFFGALVFFYGSSLLQSIKFNVNSLEELKNIFGSRILSFIALIIVYLFLLFKICLAIKLVFAFRRDNKEFLFVLTFIVLDIAVIPNILSLGLVTILYICISLLLNGLACVKLVFSISSKSILHKMKVSAC